MKNLKSIGLYFILPFLAYVLGILTHIGYLNYFYPNKYSSNEAIYLEEEVYETASGSSVVTTCDTRYILTEYNLEDHSKTERQEQIPDMYLGMDRTGLEDALAEYRNHPTLEDIEKGFCDIRLESFSSSKIHITKSYQPPEKSAGYYLMVLDGKIVVMEKDQETIYLTTDIYADALSDSLKKELLLGKYIQTIDELYGVLESYTS